MKCLDESLNSNIQFTSSMVILVGDFESPLMYDNMA